MSRSNSYPIVVFGDDWGRHVSSLQHLFRSVLECRQVVWVDGIGHRIPRFRRADIRRAWEKGMATTAHIVSGHKQPDFASQSPDIIVHPRVLPWHHRRPVRALNVWSLRRSIRQALGRLGRTDAPVVVTGSPPSAPAIPGLGAAAVIYFCMDDFSHLAGVSSAMLEGFETALLAFADATVATARRLTESKAPATKRVHYLPQGVNYSHFAHLRPEPRDLRDLPRPLIGFAGGVSSCCDLSLLREVADRHPDGSVVLVGPVVVDVGALDRDNIHLLGSRSYADLPAYVQQFDVGLIPYILNDWTRSVDPLKLLEYLAAGVPVVSTDIPEVRKYSDFVSVAPTRAQFLAEVDRALGGRDLERSERGRECARGNSWSQRATEFLNLVDSIVEEKRQVGVTAIA